MAAVVETAPVVVVASEEPVSKEEFVASVVENLHPSSAELVRPHILAYIPATHPHRSYRQSFT